MAALRLVTYLGPNIRAPATSIAASLTAALGRPVEVWAAPDDDARRAALSEPITVLAWMCGLVSVQAVDGGAPVAILAAPIFPGRTTAVYGSVIIVRRADRGRLLGSLSGARLAVNEASSWSGHHALRAHLGARDDACGFSSVVDTGSQVASIAAVLAGDADIASVDDTVWDYLLRTDPRLGELAVIDRTRSWPAPPFSVPRHVEPAVRDAIAGLLPTLRPTGLEGIVAATSRDYDPIRDAMILAGALP
jgi:ABC-type phosphate/phosphonate transport system substrate-binding protein